MIECKLICVIFVEGTNIVLREPPTVAFNLQEEVAYNCQSKVSCILLNVSRIVERMAYNKFPILSQHKRWRDCRPVSPAWLWRWFLLILMYEIAEQKVSLT